MLVLLLKQKKDGLSFGLDGRAAGRPYKLNGPVLSKGPLPKNGIMQAIRYCGSKNSELACVTNGNEWIIFRGSRLCDGKDTLSGMAFIFPTLDSIKENFVPFFDLLGRPRVEKFVFRALFQEAEGKPIRARAFSRTLRPVDGYRLLNKSALSQDVDRVMAAFFRKISGDDDPEMLAKCFVTTKESQIADEKLARITDDLFSKVQIIDTNEALGLRQVLERVKETSRNEFVLLFGTKGSGKSTFIDRFFRHVIKRDLKDQCIIVRLDVGKNSGEISSLINWLNEKLLNFLESDLFGDYGPTYDELQGMFFDEYTRRFRGPFKHLYDTDKPQFKRDFGIFIETVRNNKPKDYIERLLKNIVLSRRKVPCLIFDNTDHFSIEFQEAVFQYARSIYESVICLVIIPITDKTSWQLSQQGALQSFDNESFFLPTPLPKTIIAKRITFLEERLSSEKKEKGSGYFLEKGIHLSFENLKGFVSSLQHIFLDSGNISRWIGNLANNDVRRCLRLSRELVASPYLRVDELVKTFMSGNTANVSEMNIKRAIIRRSYNFYPTGVNEFVQNVFALNTEIDSTPLITLRLLRLLRDAKHHDVGGLEDYITTEQVFDYIQYIGIDRSSTMLCLDAMLKTGLCYSYDPTIDDIKDTKKIQLSPSGLQHLHWGSWDETYIGSMLQVTPIENEEIFDKLKMSNGEGKKDRWLFAIKTFIEYLINEDDVYVNNIDHPSYEGQLKLKRSFQKKLRSLQERIART